MTEAVTYDTIHIVSGPDGLHVDGPIPDVVAWSFKLFEMLMAGGSSWCEITDDDGLVITMALADGPLRYRLRPGNLPDGSKLSDRVVD